VCPNDDPFIVPGALAIFPLQNRERSLINLSCLFDVQLVYEAVMRLPLGTLAIVIIPAWICFHAAPAAAQTFDERWSTIPKAHAEPAPPALQAEPVPATPEEKKPRLQAQPPIGGESVQGSEDRSDTQSPNRVFSGKASFYSYKTGKTASGTKFDRDLPTAAHRSLPFGTKVRVTDIATSRSVVVVITDRGPRIRDRVLDLSLDAARRLGITDRGVAQVRVEVL
jgi:rare lipoprotein A (peptidoglycan hydrolase)